ncbi:MAG: hypothetical protein HWD61_09425 [Parachlamydiaceae bacterium]|nr:MAG: hypothetical protein HWD61_09425 [Parachlamydiaceae bacterium]
MNEACETQNKNSRFVRWIKCILSVILPVDLFVSIKADQVASNYIKFVERHKEYLNDKGALEKSKKCFSS